MDEKDYLREGKFTEFDNTSLEVIAGILGIKERETLLGKISFYVSNYLKLNEPRNMFEFRKRTASEIIKSGYCNGCSDYGLVFSTLSRLSGIPTKYIETIKKDNLKWKPDNIEGHVFTDVFLKGQWIPYEPKNGFLTKGYWLGDDDYVKVGEGLDFSELKLNGGEIVNLDSINKIRKLRNSLSIESFK